MTSTKMYTPLSFNCILFLTFICVLQCIQSYYVISLFILDDLNNNLRYFVPQVPITGKMLNGYLMFSVKNIVQNVKLIELWGKKFAPLHYVISKS